MKTKTPAPPADPRAAARRLRIDAIRDGATVHSTLGMASLYRRLPSGEHEIAWRGRLYVGETLAEAIGKAREGAA